jgi:VanZ family protein
VFLRFLPKQPLLRLLLLLAWLTCVIVLSLTAKPPRPPAFLSSDKLQHACAYAVLTLLTAGVLVPRIRNRIRGWLLSAFCAALVGIALEVAQKLMHSRRHGDLYDVAANLFGIFLIAMLGILLGSRADPPPSE